jgi:hypothetical protein
MTDESDMTVPMTRGEVYQAFEVWTKDLIKRVRRRFQAEAEASR